MVIKSILPGLFNVAQIVTIANHTSNEMGHRPNDVYKPLGIGYRPGNKKEGRNVNLETPWDFRSTPIFKDSQ